MELRTVRAASSPSGKTSPDPERHSVLGWLKENINLLVAVALIAFGALITDRFFTPANITNILKQIAVNGILACGFTFVLLSGGFDLSLGATVSLCACLLIGFQNAGMSMYPAILLVLAIGMAIGSLNAFIINLIRAELSDVFIVTLGTSLLMFSIALTYTRGYELYISDPAFTRLGKGFVMGIIPVPFLIMLVAAVIAQIVLAKTRLGRKVYLVGGSKTASFLSGINVPRIKYFVFIMSGLFGAIAAVTLTARTTGANAASGRGYEFDAAIAAIIGGNVLGGGKGGMGKTLIGVVILGVMVNIMNITGVPTVVQMVIKGLVLILTIYVDSTRKRTAVRGPAHHAEN